MFVGATKACSHVPLDLEWRVVEVREGGRTWFEVSQPGSWFTPFKTRSLRKARRERDRKN